MFFSNGVKLAAWLGAGDAAPVQWCLAHMRRRGSDGAVLSQGTLIPYEYTIALAENAADNGVEVRLSLLRRSVSDSTQIRNRLHIECEADRRLCHTA